MFHHPATQENLRLLRERGAELVGPDAGRHASGDGGDGRMSEPETILGALRRLLGRTGPLQGKRVVVSAGGTREALDPVRYLGNRSSGRMGHALAGAAIAAGAEVTLVTSAPLPAPYGATVVPVESAADMLAAVERASRDADVLIMAAAVADFRPGTARPGKIKKQPGQETLTIELVRNPDILASIDRPGLIKVGFAAETEDLLDNASDKLRRKGLAMIVANDAAATIGSSESAAHLLFANAPPLSLPQLPKEEVAEAIVEQLVRIVSERA